MTCYIAFLRAINVGHGRTMKMESLRQLFESLGFSGVATFIASGNVVFETATKDTQMLERKIEKRLQKALGYQVATFIRTDAELAEIAAYKPFPQSESDAAAEFNVIFLAEALDRQLKQKVMALTTDTDKFHVHGREIYWLRRPRSSGSAFSTVPLEKILDRPFTIRGSKTVAKIVLKYCSSKT